MTSRAFDDSMVEPAAEASKSPGVEPEPAPVSEDADGGEEATAAPARRRRKTGATVEFDHGWTDDETRDFLARALEALLAEGFNQTPMQYRKKGQVFGVVKEHGHELQLHVRAFENGVIESEVELSNRYIEHLWSPRRSAHAEITKIFEKHGVQTDTVNTEFRTRTGADRDQMPRTLTKTKDVVRGAVGLAGAVGAVAIARFIQKKSTDERSSWRGRGR